MSEEGLLEAKQVHAYYGPVPALVNLSFLVRAGEIVTLLGANGAGKTTTLRTIYGVLPAVRGDIFFAGHSIKGWAPQKLVGLGMCYVPEGAKVFAPMTVLDNLILGSYCRRKRANKEAVGRDLSMVHALFPVLRKSHGRLAGTLSGGEQQMLALARALMSSPKLLLLDEPSLGLAPMLITEVMRLIARLKEQGLSVLLAEQNARSALRIADRGYVMERGQITIEGTTEELLSNENVRAAYIGSKTLRNMQERDSERKRMVD